MTRLVLAALALACATPAHAEWQGIEWGMTSEEIEAADTDIAVYRLDEPRSWRMRPITSAVGGTWSHEGHDYALLFFVNEKGKLELIEMEPAGLACRDTLGSFADRFGDAEKESSPIGPATRTIARWRLGKDAVLTTLVVHFPSSDEWTCKSTIRAPFGR